MKLARLLLTALAVIGLLAGCTAGEARNMKSAYPIEIELTGTLETTGDFTDLDDVPDTYAGHAGEFPVVSATEDGLEFTSATSNYTDEMSMDAAAGMIQNGVGITWAYDDGANTLTPTVTASGYTDENAMDAVGDNLTDSASINFTYNDAGDNITAAVLPAGVDHGSLGGIGDDDHTIYLLADGTRTLSGNWTIGEYGIILDTALSADGKYSGTTIPGTAGATLAFGDLIYLAVADSRWKLADADSVAAGTMMLGICVQVAAADGDATTVLLYGKVRADAVFPALTVGAPVFISTTDGDITNTAPSGAGDIIRVIGYGTTADELYFFPAGTWVEHA